MMTPQQLRARDTHRATRNEVLGLGRMTDRSHRRDLTAISAAL